MKSILYSLSLSLSVIINIAGQSSSKSIHVGASVIPQISSLWNEKGNWDGGGRAALGYVVEANLTKGLTERLKFRNGIELQKADLKQRYHNLQWPADVINGQFDPTRSYEQYEAKYMALGLDAGILLALNAKENGFSVSSSVIVRQVLNTDENFIINESGHLHDPEELMNTFNKTQIFLSLGLHYQFRVSSDLVVMIGPDFEYSIRDLLRTSQSHLLWTYNGGHPFFAGLAMGVYFSGNKPEL